MVYMFSATAYGQETIPAEEASKNIGETVTICSKVFETKLSRGFAKRTFLHIGANHADSMVIVVIEPQSRKRFDYKPEKDLLNRDICVTGKIEMVDGKLQMKVTKQDDIKIK
jgi:hypothetical protein